MCEKWGGRPIARLLAMNAAGVGKGPIRSFGQHSEQPFTNGNSVWPPWAQRCQLGRDHNVPSTACAQHGVELAQVSHLFGDVSAKVELGKRWRTPRAKSLVKDYPHGLLPSEVERHHTAMGSVTIIESAREASGVEQTQQHVITVFAKLPVMVGRKRLAFVRAQPVGDDIDLERPLASESLVESLHSVDQQADTERCLEVAIVVCDALDRAISACCSNNGSEQCRKARSKSDQVTVQFPSEFDVAGAGDRKQAVERDERHDVRSLFI